MKNTLLFCVLFSFISLLIISCKETPQIDVKDKDSVFVDKNKLTPRQYREWKGRWDRKGVEYTDSVLTEYFTMPLIDLTEFATEGNHFAARFVLGLDSTVTGLTPHIMLVGVDNLGASKVPPYAVGNIYDVTKPCPFLCGENSIK